MSVKKNKTTGKWEAWFYVRTETGELKYKAKKGFKTKQEAQQYELVHRHSTEANANITFGELAKEALQNSNSNDYSVTTTLDTLKRNCPILWNTPIRKISKQYMLNWREEFKSSHLKTASKNFHITRIKQIFKYGEKIYGFEDAGKVLARYPKKLEDMKEMRIINYEEFCRIRDAEEDPVLKAFFQVLFMTGCRKGEARALYKEDYDGSQLKIYKTLRPGQETPSSTKNKTHRTVVLDNETIEYLNPLLEREGKYLFGDFKPIPATRIEKHFSKNLTRGNLPKMRIHDLRHSNVSMLWAAGVPIPEISKRIGHTTPAVTMSIYAHIFDNSQTASVSYLNKLITK